MKTAFVLIAVLGAAACQNDTSELADKIDKLDKKVDQLLKNGGGGGQGAQRPQRPRPDAAKTYAVPIEGDPFDGPADAKVTVVKAYDYACPYCDRVRGTMDQLRQKYGNDLRVVYKQFVVHPQMATAGALAFCAAGKQGKAIEMDKLLWEKGFKAHNFDQGQVQMRPDPTKPAPPPLCWDSPDGCPVVLADAKELGLDEAKFKADMKDCMQQTQKDQHELQAFGVAATPSFFINGRFVEGAGGVENFSAVVDDELKKANDRIAQGTPQADYYKQWVLDKGAKSLAQ